MTSTPSPLTPRSANKTSARPPSPTKTPHESPTKKTMQTPTKVAPSSPFVGFSPVVVASKDGNSRPSSPMKKPSSLSISFQEDDEDFGAIEVGDCDVSGFSIFSDLSAEYLARPSEKEKPTVAASPKRSPVKTAPQTPGRSPSKLKATTPRTVATATPRTAPRSVRSTPASPKATEASPAENTRSSPSTPKANGDQTQNLLLDFTPRFENIARPKFGGATPRRIQSALSRKGSPTKTALPPATPTESRFFSLLDFTPGPVATPGSIPSFTPREVEELKATFNSQVAQLKAQLSGREVEVTGLRTAVEETEARCAELSNILKDQNEKFEEEKRAWNEVKAELGELFEKEKAEKESFSSLLVEKETVVESLSGELDQKDTEVKNLKKRLRDTEDELERTREEVIRVKTEAETAAAATPVAPLSGPAVFDEEAANKRTQEEIERVAMELHQLYKTKHETKVAALKKSYESRWEKKVAALQQQVEALSKKNEELAKELEQKNSEELKKDMEFAPVKVGDDQEAAKKREEEAKKREEEAKRREEAAKKREEAAEKREEDLMKRVTALERQLDEEREERQGVIALADELLTLQSRLAPPPPPPPQPEEKKVAVVEKTVAVEKNVAAVEEPPKKPAAPASGLRSNIERMGMGSKKAQMRAAFLKAAAEKDVLAKEAGMGVKTENNEGEA